MMNYSSFDITKWYNRFGGHGNGIILKGRVRSGKTYLVGIIAKLMILKGFVIISNVRFANSEYEKYKGKIFYVSSDLDFFQHYLNIPEKTKILLIWDDAQASDGFKSTHTIRKSGDALQTFLIFIGKLETNYLILMHNYLIPYSLIDGFEPMFIYKLNRESFYVGHKYLESNNEVIQSCYQIPVPKPEKFKGIETLTKAIAMFEWKLDLKEMFDFVSRFEYGENLRKGISDYLEQNIDLISDSKYDKLKKISYQDLYLSLCLKRNMIIPESTPINKLVNPNSIAEMKRLIRKEKLISE